MNAPSLASRLFFFDAKINEESVFQFAMKRSMKRNEIALKSLEIT